MSIEGSIGTEWPWWGHLSTCALGLLPAQTGGQSWRHLVNKYANLTWAEPFEETKFPHKEGTDLWGVFGKNREALCWELSEGCEVKWPPFPAEFWWLMCYILLYPGSRLVVPCKVFLGTDTSSNTIVWWMANSTFISVAYPRGRVTEGLYQ